MTAHLHWLLFANGLAPLLCCTIVWVCEHPNGQGLKIEGALAMAATLATLNILNLVAAGMVWP